MKITKTELFFILSPITAIPLILKDVYNNKANAYFLIILIFAFASYLYLPENTDDKAYYFKLHEIYKVMTLNQLFLNISMQGTDFIFYLIIFLFAKAGFTFSFTSAIITGLTVYLYLLIYQINLSKFNLNKYISFFFFIMFITTISLPGIFSGIRFYLASAFVLFGLYESIIERKTLKGIVFLTLGTFTHFSVLIYLVFVLFYIISKKNTTLIKIIFIFSFIFLILPKDLLISYLGFLDGLSDVYKNKINAYVIGDRYNEIVNTGHYIFIFVNNIWYYIVGIFLIYNIRNKNNEYFNLLLILFTIANLTSFSQVIFTRYSYISVSFFVLFLIYEYASNNNKFIHIIRNLFLILMLNRVFLDILVHRDVFYESYFRMNILTLATIIIMDPTDGKNFKKR